MSTQYHVKLAPGDVAPYVLLPGDPGRVPVVASYWDEAREVARNREYVTYTGTYRGAPISCTSTGIGAPSTAIAVEEPKDRQLLELPGGPGVQLSEIVLALNALKVTPRDLIAVFEALKEAGALRAELVIM